MNANSINGTHTPEKKMLELFRGACLAVRAMHTYRPSKKPSGSGPLQENNNASSSFGAGPSSIQPPSRPHSPIPDHEAHESHQLLNHPSSNEDHDDVHADDGEGEGYSYPQGASIPQAIGPMEASKGSIDVIFDGDAELRKEDDEVEAGGEIVPYAHRDIKPA